MILVHRLVDNLWITLGRLLRKKPCLPNADHTTGYPPVVHSTADGPVDREGIAHILLPWSMMRAGMHAGGFYFNRVIRVVHTSTMTAFVYIKKVYRIDMWERMTSNQIQITKPGWLGIGDVPRHAAGGPPPSWRGGI